MLNQILYLIRKVKSLFNFQIITLYTLSALFSGLIFWAGPDNLSHSTNSKLKSTPGKSNFRRSFSNKRSVENNQLLPNQSNLFKPSLFKFMTAIKGGTQLTNPSVDLFSQDPQNHDIFASLENYSFGLWKCFYEDWSKGIWNFYPQDKFSSISITNISYYFNPKGDLQSYIMWIGTANSGFYTAILNHDDNGSLNPDKTIKKPNRQMFQAPSITSTINYIQANQFYGNTFFVDNDHNFWMSAAGIGLFMSPGIFTKDNTDPKYNYYDHKKWLVIDSNYSFLGTFNFNHSNISYISEDDDGNYYFGARDYRTGFVKISGTKNSKNKIVYNKAKITSIVGNASINYVVFHKDLNLNPDLIYICANGTIPNSDDGLYIYDIKKKTINIAPELKSTSVTKVLFDKGDRDVVFAVSTDGLYEQLTGTAFQDNDAHNGISKTTNASGWQRISQFDRNINVNNLFCYQLYQPKNTVYKTKDKNKFTKNSYVTIVNTSTGIYEYSKESSTSILANRSVSGVSGNSFAQKESNNSYSYYVNNKMFFHYWSNNSFTGTINFTNKDTNFHQSFPVTASQNKAKKYNFNVFFTPTFLDPNAKDKNKIPKSIIDKCKISINLSEDSDKNVSINDNLFLYVIFYPDLSKLPKDFFIPSFSGNPKSQDKTFLNYDYSGANSLYFPLIYCLNITSVTFNLTNLDKLLLQTQACNVGTLAVINHRSSITNWKSFEDFNLVNNKLTISQGFYQIYLFNQIGQSYKFYLQVGGDKINTNFFAKKPFNIPKNGKSRKELYVETIVPLTIIVLFVLSLLIFWSLKRKKSKKYKLLELI